MQNKMKAESINNTMRIDKWLWCARFFKTRATATEAVKNGKVKLNGDKIKPSKIVSPGEEYSIRSGAYTWTITVKALADNRKSPAEAATLYEEQQESIEKRTTLAKQISATHAGFPRSHGRPTKRDRRQLIRFMRDEE